MTIRLGFENFWPGFVPFDNYFVRKLNQKYNICVCSHPEVVIYANFGEFERVAHVPTKIFYTGEPITADLTQADYAFSFDYVDDPRHYRLPLYGLSGSQLAVKPVDYNAEQVFTAKNRFCNFVYGHASAMRDEFFKRLSNYKRVDAGGSHLNNVGGLPLYDNKLAFIAPYKFTIAFESLERIGFTTEKIYHPMMVNSVPIYWGNPYIARDFNTRSFVNYYEGRNLDSLVSRVVELDENDDQYLAMLNEPWYVDNVPNEYVDERNVLAFFNRIF